MKRRHIRARLEEALGDTPVVLLNGARQTGKSTLARQVVEERGSGRYLTLDDAAVLRAARRAPAELLADLDEPAVIDEVQRAPELFLAIKVAVDRRRAPGRFLLTGSANPLLLPRIADSLAGRMEIQTLWPLSEGEIEGVREGFIDAAFGDQRPPSGLPVLHRGGVVRRILRGGYPEVTERPAADRRAAWFNNYVVTMLQRDVRDLASIDVLSTMPRLFALLAARTMTVLNVAGLARDLGVPLTTLTRYLTLLRATFIVDTIPGWSANLGSRVLKTPKLVMNDTGLVAAQLGLDEHALEREPHLLGPLLENFVAMELRKQAGWNRTRITFYHLRMKTGQEVDLVLEDPRRRIVGIEVKATRHPTVEDLAGLRHLATVAKGRFHRGYLLHLGEQTVPYGGGLYGVPISALWSWGATVEHSSTTRGPGS